MTNSDNGLGKWKPWTNLTAVALVMGMFWQSQQEFYKNAREDRGLFKEEMHGLQQSCLRQWQVLRDNQKSIENMGKAVDGLAEEMRKDRERKKVNQ